VEAYRRSYYEMMQFKTYSERLEYLQLNGVVGRDTFGHGRYLNQRFYASKEWKDFRREIILRDQGYDLGVVDDDYIIFGKVLIHHINPIKFEDMKSGDIKGLLDPNNVICVSDETHRAIHYGMEPREVIFTERYENDTAPWR
jgi:hypothetical protein